MSLPDFSNPSNRLSVVAGARIGVTSAYPIVKAWQKA